MDLIVFRNGVDVEISNLALCMFNSFISGSTNLQFDPELAAFLEDSQEESPSPRNLYERQNYSHSPYSRPAPPLQPRISAPAPRQVNPKNLSTMADFSRDTLPFMKEKPKKPQKKIVSYRKPNTQHPEIKDFTLQLVEVDSIFMRPKGAQYLYETFGL